jgi:hypothetical protein
VDLKDVLKHFDEFDRDGDKNGTFVSYQRLEHDNLLLVVNVGCGDNVIAALIVRDNGQVLGYEFDPTDGRPVLVCQATDDIPVAIYQRVS